MQSDFNPQAYYKWTRTIEQRFDQILIPISQIRARLKMAASMNVSEDSPIIEDLKDFAERLEKIRVPQSQEDTDSPDIWHLPTLFEHCVYAQTAGKGWTEDVKTRWLLLNLIKHRTQEALSLINLSPSMISSQPKLVAALQAFELVAKLGQDLEKYPSWKKFVSSLTTEAKTLSSAKPATQIKPRTS